MKWVDIGIAFVFVSNALFLVMTSVLAWRLLYHARRSHEELSEVAGRLRSDADRIARTSHDALDVFGGIRGELSQLLEAARRAGGAGHAGASGADDSDGSARALCNLLGEQGALIDEVSRVEPHQFAEWRDRNRGELERVLAQKYRVQTELERLRVMHEESQRHVRDLQHKTRAQQHASAENVELKSELDQLRGDLEVARDRARKHELRANALSHEVEKLRHTATQPLPPTADESRLRELEARLAATEGERSRLARQLDQIQDTFQRTLTEKEFIEDRFLALDAAQG